MECSMKKSYACIFDSGVGGLTVFSEIQKRLPSGNYIYCSDNKNFPYGLASEDQVISFVMNAVEKITNKYRIDLLVVACNTASTVVLPVLRQKYDFPIVGVVPAIKPAAQITKTGEIAVLATKGTINRNYTDGLISEFASHCKTHKIGSSKLVEMAENKIYGTPVHLGELETEILFLKLNPQIDVVVLACTHFPLLKAEISQVLAREITFVDSGSAIGERVKFLSESHHLNFINNTIPDVCFLLTAKILNLPKLSEYLKFQFKVNNVEIIGC